MHFECPVFPVEALFSSETAISARVSACAALVALLFQSLTVGRGVGCVAALLLDAVDVLYAGVSLC